MRFCSIAVTECLSGITSGIREFSYAGSPSKQYQPTFPDVYACRYRGGGKVTVMITLSSQGFP